MKLILILILRTASQIETIGMRLHIKDLHMDFVLIETWLTSIEREQFAIGYIPPSEYSMVVVFVFL